MNDRQFEKKMRQDANKVIKDVHTLLEDGAAQLGRFEERMSQGGKQAKEDLVNWAEESASQMGDGFEKVTGSMAQKVTDHPWVAISVGLAFGFVLGSLLKPARQIRA
jgi:ElaB/YqjD/DUF883 family membrane-anchored ribosome-binding protein